MRGVWPIPFLLLAAFAYASGDPDSGLRTWLRLRGELRDAEVHIAEVRGRVAALEREARDLEKDPFAVERAIREDLGWALPGETILRDAPTDVSTSRFD